MRRPRRTKSDTTLLAVADMLGSMSEGLDRFGGVLDRLRQIQRQLARVSEIVRRRAG